MSVYKRSGEKTYSYRFQVGGCRFSGQTGLTNKSEALKFEADERERVKNSAIPLNSALTFSQAASRYWTEHGQHLKMAGDLFRYFGWLEAKIGGNTMLASITDSEVANLVAMRRGEGVSNTTVNRSVLEPLRMIVRRTDLNWKLPVPAIDWGRHRLSEPQEVVREASPAEEDALLAAIRPDYWPVIAFALLSGCRQAEIVNLVWTDVEWFSQQIRIKGKGDKTRTIPLTKGLQEILQQEHGHHSHSVFTYRADRTRNGLVKGQRYPITKSGLKTMWRRSRAKSGVENFRFHDLRHTAATRLLRATGNLRLAQALLGHANIDTTQRYAHIQTADLALGMEKMSSENGTENGTKDKNTAKNKVLAGGKDE